MQREREILIKRVFPEIREKCRERGVEFVDVDLRWGVTEEEQERGEVVRVCLEEIDRCRPYFIGIIGERYGWMPRAEDLLRETRFGQGRFNWVFKDAEVGHSLTEIEFMHGVLNNPDKTRGALFYFRDPAYLETLPERERIHFRENTQTAIEKLTKLKTRIRSSGYALRENYPNPETLGNLVREDLWSLIEARFPATQVPDELERERSIHATFAARRRRSYIANTSDMHRLDQHLNSISAPLIVAGLPGSGKSALLANWIAQCRETDSGAVVIEHYIGAGGSSDGPSVLRRIMAEIKSRYAKSEEVPQNNNEIIQSFPAWLVQIPGHEKLVIAIDGLNQLDRISQTMGWLPVHFPSSVRVVVSTTYGELLESLRKRNWPELIVNPISEPVRTELIHRYLGDYGKSLSVRHLLKIAAHPSCGNPLFLRTVLEELRIFGAYEQLGKRVEYYLDSPSLDDLFQRVLDRLEADYSLIIDTNGQSQVKDVMSLLWAARRGLSEAELLDLTGLQRVQLSGFLLSLSDHLSRRYGLLSFFHDHLRHAVELRYCSDSVAKHAAHKRLADYFLGQDISDRKVDELPWQLRAAGEREKLADVLTDIEMFYRAYRNDQYAVLLYWKYTGKSGEELANLCLKKLNRHLSDYQPRGQAIAAVIIALIKSLREFDFPDGIWKLVKALEYAVLEVCTGDTGLEMEYLYTLGLMALNNGELSAAEDTFRSALSIAERSMSFDDRELALINYNLAATYEQKGDLLNAKNYHQRALDLREKTVGSQSTETARSLNALGRLLGKSGDLKGAETRIERALVLQERFLAPEDPDLALTLSDKAELLIAKGNLNQAESCIMQALGILEKVFGGEHVRVANDLTIASDVYFRQGAYDKSEAVLRRALAILKKNGKWRTLSAVKAMYGMGKLFKAKENYPYSEIFFREALAVYVDVVGKDTFEIADIIEQLGAVLALSGNYQAARQCFSRAKNISAVCLGINHEKTQNDLKAIDMMNQRVAMQWHVEIVQNGQVLPQNGNVVRLKKQQFSIHVALPSPLVVKLNVLDNEHNFIIVRPCLVLDFKKAGFQLHPFMDGMGTTEAPFNKDEILSIGKEGFHYMYYSDQDDHRWSRVEQTDKGIVCVRNVSCLYLNKKTVLIEDFLGDKLYLIFLLKHRDDGVVHDDELWKIVLSFQ